ncbi:Hypothetical protein SCF082_LOCUS32326 [Durusdinium trenchii]|uniref:HTH OST-type domain-containing protein n=1 Tax=Durusdinium trenchii TaxID=1381693 RepID=A0ABP0NG24_9DINO
MGGVRRRGGRTRRSDDAKEAANEATATKPKRASRASQGIKPEQDEVLQCIESLYQDKLKPFGRILRKRVAERHVEPFVAGRMELPDVDVQHLREVCEASESLLLTPEEGGDWSATFKDRSQHFVDIYSTTDDFAPSIWHAATQYFKTLPEEEALLPGGRYSCAQALLQRSLDFLEGFSLGEVCHLVQLAISKHKILGYCNGAVVPYSRSQSRVKEECAVSQQPCQAQKEDVANTKAPQLELASLTKARQCLKEILQSAELPDSTGPSMIPLSNVKRLFRSRYQTELSETSLGHSKLSELLQDERFADICEVQLQGQGYIVVQVLGDDWEEVEDLEVPRYTGSEEGLESLAVDCALTPLTPVQDDDGFPNPTEEVTPVLRTPLASPGLATPNTVSRWTVYNWGMQGHSMWGEAPPLPLGGGVGPGCSDGAGCDATDSTVDSARTGDQAARERSRSRTEPPSPAPAEHDGPEAPETPMKVELSILQRMHATVQEDEEEPRARIPFCPGEPLALEEALDLPPGLPDAAEHVKNTFIHSAVTPLVTPEPAGYRRSQSVPKEMGVSEARSDLRVVPETPAFLVPPTPSSPIFSRGYEALLMPQMDFMVPEHRVIRLADLI